MFDDKTFHQRLLKLNKNLMEQGQELKLLNGGKIQTHIHDVPDDEDDEADKVMLKSSICDLMMNEALSLRMNWTHHFFGTY